MGYEEVVDIIYALSEKDFTSASGEVVNFIDSYPNFSEIISQIGTIPESILHDSTEEKLFSKASDAVLARAFREIGLKSAVLTERGDSADVISKSIWHSYSLVADAKSFRMSRTAKNQKDFKINSLSGWKKESDYAVLCSPYFQYPSTQSQIYQQAIINNVCLFSWEYMLFLIDNSIKESKTFSLEPLWTYSKTYAASCTCSNIKKSFIQNFDKQIAVICNLEESVVKNYFNGQRNKIVARATVEKNFWEQEISRIKKLSHGQAINELLKSKKIEEKIRQIDCYIKGL